MLYFYLIAAVALTFSYFAPQVSGKSFCQRDETKGKLFKQLVVVMRHGIRTPVRTFPNDIYQEDFWERFSGEIGGFGELTRDGITELHQFGEWVGMCYSRLNRTANVTTYSTDYDRTLMSAQAFLAGLLSDPNTNNLEVLLPMILKPIRALPQTAQPYECEPGLCSDNDYILVETGLKDLKYRRLLSEIARQAGLDNSSYGFVGKSMADAVSVEQSTNLTLVDWISRNKTILSFMQEAIDFYFQVQYNNSVPPRTLAFTSPLLNFLKPFMNDDSVLDPDLLVVSAHDTYVAAMLAALGAFNGKQPPFSSSILFELSRKESDHTNQVYISTFYRNDSIVDPFPIKVRNGCGYSCDLNTFWEAMAEAMVAVVRHEHNEIDLANINEEDEEEEYRKRLSSDVKIGLLIFLAFCAATIVITSISSIACGQHSKKDILSRLGAGNARRRRRLGNRRKASDRKKHTAGYKRIPDSFINRTVDSDDDDDSALLMSRLPVSNEEATTSSTAASTSQPLLMSEDINE